MKNLILLCIISIFACSCRSLYYGYLPGTNYKLLKPITELDLQGRTFNIEFKDNRGSSNRITCSEHTLNRKTELEGELGMRYFRESIITMIQNSNGKVSGDAADKLTIELEALSFRLTGAGFIVAHGFVQFKVSSPYLQESYCADMTDHDQDAPLKWYSLVTRKTGTRLIVSGSMRRTAENFVRDLAELSAARL